jgi:hypothetical protein
MISNEQCFNYKVVDFIEIYNFHRKFISIRVHLKQLCFLKLCCGLPPFHLAVLFDIPFGG